MLIPRVRLTIRMLMVGIAGVVLAVGGSVLRWRAVEYHRLSTAFVEMERQEDERMVRWKAAKNYKRNGISTLSGAEFYVMRWRSEQDTIFIDQTIADARSERDRFRHARQVCERAARCPLIYYADAPLPPIDLLSNEVESDRRPM